MFWNGCACAICSLGTKRAYALKELVRASEDRGSPLPFRFVPGLDLYPGFLTILLAAPNVGKSFLGLNWAVDLVNQGEPVLYHTTDTDYGTQAKRLVALLKDMVINDVTRYETSHLGEYVLPLRWSQANVDSGNFEELVKAEVEYLGRSPALIIVDVANDIRRGEENVGNVRDVFIALHKIARRYGTTIMAMHHVKRGFASNGKVPPRMDEGQYGGEQVAEVVLSLSRPNTDELRLDVLKNRTGKAGYYVSLPFVQEKGRIG